MFVNYFHYVLQICINMIMRNEKVKIFIFFMQLNPWNTTYMYYKDNSCSFCLGLNNIYFM